MRAIVFVDRKGLYYFGGDAKNALSLTFPPTSVQDMEVISGEELSKVISDFVKANKLKPADVLLCFSSQCYFEKVIPEKTSPEEIETLRMDFTDNVPFNKVLSKPYTQGNTTVIVALNKEFAYAIKNVFESAGFTTQAIVPTFALYGQQSVTFSGQVGGQLMKHFNSLQQVSFPVKDEEPKNVDRDEKEFSTPKKQSNNRLYLLLGVFAVLIVILVAFYFYMQKKRAPKQISRQPIDITAPATVPILPSATPTTASPTATLKPDIPKEDIEIRVLNGSGIAGEADRVQDRLAEADFTNVTTGNAPTLDSEKTSIVFKPSVPRSYKDEITTMIKSLGYEVTTRENDELTSDVLITTYRQDEEE
ncbi:LytR C-terminal domain-containing protein [Candidatus Roizmanbacteria bacterium]|nr:MAG: LytR C-terminal domain-containing protein [Candidatus Roizmanbacteria bacterium]